MEPLNNEGRIAFEGLLRAPTVEEWGKRVNAECR
jgi:aryl carrier-like protein